MKVKDMNGVVVEGLERGPNNSLIVNDKSSYNKYKMELEKANRIKTLEHEVSNIKNSLSEILSLLKQDR